MNKNIEDMKIGETYFIPGLPPTPCVWRGTDLDISFFQLGLAFSTEVAAKRKFNEDRNR